MEATITLETFWVKAASVARVTKKPYSLVALSVQFKVVLFGVTVLKVKFVTSPETTEGGVKLYILLLPSADEWRLGIFVELVYEFKLKVAP